MAKRSGASTKKPRAEQQKRLTSVEIDSQLVEQAARVADNTGNSTRKVLEAWIRRGARSD
jgi:hypothetical protein